MIAHNMTFRALLVYDCVSGRVLYYVKYLYISGLHYWCVWCVKLDSYELLSGQVTPRLRSFCCNIVVLSLGPQKEKKMQHIKESRDKNHKYSYISMTKTEKKERGM